jgi:hypothetical protein
MNLYDLTSKTLRQCRFDPTDATDRAENQSWITETLNEAYRRICGEKLNPWHTEAVTLDANKCFNILALTKQCVNILKISLYQDYSVAASGAESPELTWDKYDGSGTVVIPTATASGTVYVEYEYMPATLGVTYGISGANTLKVIPVAKAITSAEAAALVGQKLYVVDVSAGVKYEYTIESVSPAIAGAATITVEETISEAVAAGDEIYIGDEWEPVIGASWHHILTYWATAQYYLSIGPNYSGQANMWLGMFDREFGYITDSIGEEQVITGAYSQL